MESEKVKEIKKVLEDNKTEHFPYIDGHKCKLLNYADILTLINELEEDKERWQRKAVNYYQRAKSYGIECIIDNDIDETLKEFLK